MPSFLHQLRRPSCLRRSACCRRGILPCLPCCPLTCAAPAPAAAAPLAKFGGPAAVELHRAVQQAAAQGRFSRPPLHIGSSLSLADGRWAAAVDVALGPLLSGWIVHSGADRAVLQVRYWIAGRPGAAAAHGPVGLAARPTPPCTEARTLVPSTSGWLCWFSALTRVGCWPCLTPAGSVPSAVAALQPYGCGHVL